MFSSKLTVFRGEGGISKKGKGKKNGEGEEKKRKRKSQKKKREEKKQITKEYKTEGKRPKNSPRKTVILLNLINHCS